MCGGALGSSVRAPGPRGHLLLDVTICFTGRVFLLEENEVQGENDRSCFFNLLGGSAVTRASSEHSDALFFSRMCLSLPYFSSDFLYLGFIELLGFVNL